jgi:hypothetical protein
LIDKTKQPQKERFIDAARGLDADENEAAFKAKLSVIARQKPKDRPKAPKENAARK